MERKARLLWENRHEEWPFRAHSYVLMLLLASLYEIDSHDNSSEWLN